VAQSAIDRVWEVVIDPAWATSRAIARSRDLVTGRVWEIGLDGPATDRVWAIGLDGPVTGP
jgi:hypothetical protein